MAKTWTAEEQIFVDIEIAKERARCAEIAETFFDWCDPIGQHSNMRMAQEFGSECAAKIRTPA